MSFKNDVMWCHSKMMLCDVIQKWCYVMSLKNDVMWWYSTIVSFNVIQK